MGEELDQSEVVTFDEALKAEMNTNQAIIELLDAKRLISKEEIMARITELVKQQHRTANASEPPYSLDP